MADKKDDRLEQIEYSTRNPYKTQGEEMGPAAVALVLIVVGILTYPLGVIFWAAAALVLAYFSPRRPR